MGIYLLHIVVNDLYLDTYLAVYGVGHVYWETPLSSRMLYSVAVIAIISLILFAWETAKNRRDNQKHKNAIKAL